MMGRNDIMTQHFATIMTRTSTTLNLIKPRHNDSHDNNTQHNSKKAAFSIRANKIMLRVTIWPIMPNAITFNVL